MKRSSFAVFFGLLVCACAVVVVSGSIRNARAVTAMQLQATPELDAPIPPAVGQELGELPNGVTVRLLASADVAGLKSNGLELSLDQLVLETGERSERVASGSELVFVSSGRIDLEIGGQLVVVDAGGQFFASAGDSYAMTAGQSGATILRLSLAAPTGATPVAGEGDANLPVRLAAGPADRLVARRGTLFIASALVEPGISTGPQALSGPAAIWMNIGSLDIATDGNPPVLLSEGLGSFVPGLTEFAAVNNQGEPAEAIVAGLLAPPTGSAEGSSATVVASPTPDAEATLRAENATLLGTVVALETEVAAAEAAVANAQTIAESIEQSAGDAQVDAQATSSAQATLVGSLETELATAQAALSASQAELQAAEESINSMAVSATTEALAQSGAIATAEAALTAAANAQSTSAALGEADAAAAQATIAAQSSAQTAEQEQNAAAAAAAAATISALQTEVAGEAAARATESANAAAMDAAAQATIDAQAAAFVAEQTIGDEESAAAGATIAAQESAIAAESAARATEAANATAAAEAARATAESQSAALTASAATVTAQASAASAASTQAAIDATAAAVAIANAEATVAALQTQVADTSSIAVASLDPNYVDEVIQVDLNGILAGNEAAIRAAKIELRRVLQKYKDDCRAGVVLTFGHGLTIGQGARLADAINEQIRTMYPTAFGKAAYEGFGDLNQPLGQVDIRIFFFTGCEPAAGAT